MPRADTEAIFKLASFTVTTYFDACVATVGSGSMDNRHIFSWVIIRMKNA